MQETLTQEQYVGLANSVSLFAGLVNQILNDECRGWNADDVIDHFMQPTREQYC